MVQCVSVTADTQYIPNMYCWIHLQLNDWRRFQTIVSNVYLEDTSPPWKKLFTAPCGLSVLVVTGPDIDAPTITFYQPKAES